MKKSKPIYSIDASQNKYDNISPISHTQLKPKQNQPVNDITQDQKGKYFLSDVDLVLTLLCFNMKHSGSQETRKGFCEYI